MPLTDAKATDGYVYDTVDQNGNALAPVSNLKPIIAEIEKSLGIDMSNYDAVIGNIYLPGQRIQTHRDTTESLSARNYPVVVYTIGAGNAINIYEDLAVPGRSTFASGTDKKTSIPTKNGTIYTFGMDGKGRFELGHDTPHAIKKGDTLDPITMPDGTVIKDYTITLTFRRAGDLAPGMPSSPTKTSTQPIASGTQVTYTPKGKEKQTYTVRGTQIFNSAGVEVFKADSVDRNKIFANLAIKEGRAVIVDYNGIKYAVNKKDQIISGVTGKIMNWLENDGTRKSYNCKSCRIIW